MKRFRLTRQQIFLGIIVLSVLATYGSNYFQPSVVPYIPPVETPVPIIPTSTIEQYNTLQDGMTIEQVQQIMGHEGSFISSGEYAGNVTKSYLWSGENGSSFTVNFYNGRLQVKVHTGF